MPVTVKTSGNAPLDALDTLAATLDDDVDDVASDPPTPPIPVGLSWPQLASDVAMMVNVPSDRPLFRKPHIRRNDSSFAS
jgi:hypothetical protein